MEIPCTHTHATLTRLFPRLGVLACLSGSDWILFHKYCSCCEQPRVRYRIFLQRDHLNGVFVLGQKYHSTIEWLFCSIFLLFLWAHNVGFSVCCARTDTYVIMCICKLNNLFVHLSFCWIRTHSSHLLRPFCHHQQWVCSLWQLRFSSSSRSAQVRHFSIFSSLVVGCGVDFSIYRTLIYTANEFRMQSLAV